jgi:hypothetical protein
MEMAERNEKRREEEEEREIERADGEQTERKRDEEEMKKRKRRKSTLSSPFRSISLSVYLSVLTYRLVSTASRPRAVVRSHFLLRMMPPPYSRLVQNGGCSLCVLARKSAEIVYVCYF